LSGRALGAVEGPEEALAVEERERAVEVLVSRTQVVVAFDGDECPELPRYHSTILESV
jgi:hypothetical protein